MYIFTSTFGVLLVESVSLTAFAFIAGGKSASLSSPLRFKDALEVAFAEVGALEQDALDMALHSATVSLDIV